MMSNRFLLRILHVSWIAAWIFGRMGRTGLTLTFCKIKAIICLAAFLGEAMPLIVDQLYIFILMVS